MPSQRAVQRPPSHEMPGPHAVFRQNAPPSAALMKTPLLQEPEAVQRTSAELPATATIASFWQVFWFWQAIEHESVATQTTPLLQELSPAPAPLPQTTWQVSAWQSIGELVQEP